MRRFAHFPLGATLAIAVAFNVVSASVLTALLERPFPYPDLGRLVLVRDARPTEGAHQGRAIAAADFFDLRSWVPALADIAAFRASPLVIANRTGADPERIEAMAVTANFFSLLGVTPLVGRGWAMDADQPGRDRMIVLSRRLWHARFGDDRSAVGREVTLNGRNVTIVGVVRDEDCYPAGVDAWIPLVMTPAEQVERATQRLGGLARIAQSASLDVAQAQIDAAATRLATMYPVTNGGRGFNLFPLRREQYEFTAPLFGLVQAAALLVLLLGIVNVTAVLVARQFDRAQELEVRWMLGASLLDLGRLIFTETAVLTGTATAIGLAVAFPALSALRSSLPEGIARWVNGWSQMRVDAAALGVGVAIGAATTAVIGGLLVSAARRSAATVGSGARTTHGRRVVRRLVVGSEIALAAALLMCALVVYHGLGRQKDTFAALGPERLLRFELTAPTSRYPDDARVATFHLRVIAAIDALPEVVGTALIRNEPASNVPSPVVTVERLDAPARTANDRPRTDLQVVSPSLFETLRLPLVSGRGFVATDSADAPRVAIASVSAVQRVWPDRNPIGTVIRLGTDLAPTRIVGVVSDLKVNWYDPAPRPSVYVPDQQSPSRTISVMVRTKLDPVVVAPQVRTAIAALDSSQPIAGLEGLTTSIADSLSPVRIIERLLFTGAVVACLLAAVGIFGILAQSVSQRAREFGVRFALGATWQSIAGMVLRDALLTGAIGLVCGLAAMIVLVRLAGSMLLGLATLTAATVGGVVTSTVALIVGAALLPALRASRVDAAALLRHDR